MVSAIHAAQEQGLQAAHLWRRDSPLGCTLVFEDEVTGSRSCDFESLFEPIPELPPYDDRGQTVRLLYEEGTEYWHQGLRILDEVAHPCAVFQHHGPFTEQHLSGVEALVVLTSLNFPIRPAKKVELYQRYFSPQGHFKRILEEHGDLLDGRWLCIHLRTQVRTAFCVPEWDLDEMVQKALEITREIEFDRMIVFSDSEEARGEFIRRCSSQVPVRVLNWGNQGIWETMFLDFLAISKATLILSSGISSFSYEASLFGGGIPVFDMCQGLLVPT